MSLQAELGDTVYSVPDHCSEVNFAKSKSQILWFPSTYKNYAYILLWSIMYTIPLCIKNNVQFTSVQFSCSVVSDSLQPHESQHARPPCPSPTPGVHSNSCPLSRWCHPAISSSVVPFSSCLQSLPASESFPMSQLFAWGFSIIPSKEHPGLISLRMDWLDLLAVQGTLKRLLQHHSAKAP